MKFVKTRGGGGAHQIFVGMLGARAKRSQVRGQRDRHSIN